MDKKALQKTEASKGRKYGECCIAEIRSIKMVDGKFIQTVHITNKPNPLPRDEAIVYYTKKLKEVWESIMPH